MSDLEVVLAVAVVAVLLYAMSVNSRLKKTLLLQREMAKQLVHMGKIAERQENRINALTKAVGPMGTVLSSHEEQLLAIGDSARQAIELVQQISRLRELGEPVN